MNIRHLSMSQLAEITGMDRRTVKDRLQDVVPIGTHGKAILYDTLEALPILLRTEAKSDKDMGKLLLSEQLRLETAKANKTTLEVEKLRGEVVHITEVAREVANEYASVRARLMSIGSRVARDLAQEITPSQAKEIVDKEVNEALTELTADTKYDEINYVEQPNTTVEADSPENP